MSKKEAIAADMAAEGHVGAAPSSFNNKLIQMLKELETNPDNPEWSPEMRSCVSQMAQERDQHLRTSDTAKGRPSAAPSSTAGARGAADGGDGTSARQGGAGAGFTLAEQRWLEEEAEREEDRTALQERWRLEDERYQQEAEYRREAQRVREEMLAAVREQTSAIRELLAKLSDRS